VIDLHRYTALQAREKIRKTVENAQRHDVIICIHGYGASGKGGGLRSAVREYIYNELFCKDRAIGGCVHCEDLLNPREMDNPYYKLHIDQYHKALETRPNLKEYAGNPGVTLLML